MCLAFTAYIQKPLDLQFRFHHMHPHNVTVRYPPTMSHWDTHTYNFDFTTCTLTMSHWDTHPQFRFHNIHPHNFTLRYTHPHHFDFTTCTLTMLHWDTHTHNVDFTACTLTMSHWDTHKIHKNPIIFGNRCKKVAVQLKIRRIPMLKQILKDDSSYLGLVTTSNGIMQGFRLILNMSDWPSKEFDTVIISEPEQPYPSQTPL